MADGAMVKIFGSTGLALALLGTANAFGFGLFLAATTMVKALTLLTGISLAFGTYAATASGSGSAHRAGGGGGFPNLDPRNPGYPALPEIQRSLPFNLMAAMHCRLPETKP
jgi:hypothetical protein